MIDETTDGISLGNGWQRWVDFEERRYYYSKGGVTTWEEPQKEDLIEEKQRKFNIEDAHLYELEKIVKAFLV